MILTTEQVLALAPDSSSASVARKLAHPIDALDLMAAAIHGRDLNAWASRHDIAAVRS